MPKKQTRSQQSAAMLREPPAPGAHQQPKKQTKSQQAAAMLREPPMPGARQHPKNQTKSLQAAAMLREPPTPGARQQHQDLPAVGAMGILTEEELRHPELYTELFRRKNQAMERDLMQLQAASTEMLGARRQNQESLRKLASQTSMILQVLSRPEVQRQDNLKGFLPRYQCLHEEANNMARPVLDVLNEEMPQTVQAMDLKGVQVSMQAQQPNGGGAIQQDRTPSQSVDLLKSGDYERTR